MSTTAETQKEPELSLDEIRARYPREYIVMEVTARDAIGQPLRGRVLVHRPTRQEAFAEAKNLNRRNLSFFNNVPPEDMEGFSYILSIL